MKNFILSFLLLAFSFTLSARDYFCTTDTNLKIFNVGNSQNIVAQFNRRLLIIRNDSNVLNTLVFKNDMFGAALFESIKTGNSEETTGLIVYVDSLILKGAKSGAFTIYTEKYGQEYNCELQK